MSLPPSPATPSTKVGIPIDDPVELDRFLAAYRPSGVAASVWLLISEEATQLVRRSGNLTRLRVEKDIQTVGAVVAHLVGRGRPISLDELLSDPVLLSYDGALQGAGAGARTRENKRGILRRLQAVHGGLPWRESRRSDGDRVQSMVQPSAVGDLARVLQEAETAIADSVAGREAAAFIGSVEHARSERGGAVAASPGTDPADWDQARRFAARHGLKLTKPVLRAVVTHELLEHRVPVAVLVHSYGLTRRDLDLALTRLPELPRRPVDGDLALLRGTASDSART